MHLENFKDGKEFGAHHGFKVCTGSHYLGGYIEDDELKKNWLRERTLTWETNINTISENTGKYPQESYAIVTKNLSPIVGTLRKIPIKVS